MLQLSSDHCYGVKLDTRVYISCSNCISKNQNFMRKTIALLCVYEQQLRSCVAYFLTSLKPESHYITSQAYIFRIDLEEE